jgi:hypothetical protein
VKRYLIALAALVLVLPALILTGCPQPYSNSGPKAAIVNQLSIFEPNQSFIDQMKLELEACGFKVDVYQGDEVNVELYRELPKYGYKLIIFRAHALLRKPTSRPSMSGSNWMTKCCRQK